MNAVHRGSRHIVQSVLALTCSATLAGCSSINGNPDPIISVSDNIGLIRPYPIDKSLVAFASSSDDLRQGMSKREYRNFVVAMYLNAIDAQYAWFRTKLSRQRRVGNVGFDVVSLGLTGIGQFAAEATAHRLSAGATALTGLRGSIDKELYFAQTLPALLAGMDAERDTVKARIFENLKHDEIEYPLALAFSDLSAYETSATLDRAIENITAQASEERKDASAKLANAIQSCDTDENLFEPRRKITNAILALEQRTDAVEQLSKIAKRTGSKATDQTGGSLSAHQIGLNIRRDLARKDKGYCSVAALDDLTAKLNADIGEQIF